MEPGSPREGPIFTYTPWLSMGAAFLATAASTPPCWPAEDRPGPGVETSLLQAALSAPRRNGCESSDPTPTGSAPGSTTSEPPKASSSARTAAGSSSGYPTRSSCSPAPRATLSSAPERLDRALNDPERIGRTRRTSWSWPTTARSCRRLSPGFPVRSGSRWAGRPGSATAGSDARGSAAGSGPAGRGRRDGRAPAPEHRSLRQAGVLYGLSATPGRVQGPLPASSVQHNRRGPRPSVDPGPPSAAGRSLIGSPPLDGVTVLDLGFAVAGPFGTQVLADLGANVIKVNTIARPVLARHATSPTAANRGKRSIGIDLKTPKG